MFCGFCHRAKHLLEQKGVVYNEIDVGMTPGARQEMIARAGGATSVPQIFIGETHVGGCDDLYELEYDGKLDALLEAA
jgi:glutaredoxin 3